VLMVTHKQKPIADVWLSVHPYRMGVC